MADELDRSAVDAAALKAARQSEREIVSRYTGEFAWATVVLYVALMVAYGGTVAGSRCGSPRWSTPHWRMGATPPSDSITHVIAPAVSPDARCARSFSPELPSSARRMGIV